MPWALMKAYKGSMEATHSEAYQNLTPEQKKG